MSGTPGYVRWQPAEWLRVAVNALPYLEKGEERFPALSKAQKRCLDKSRHRDEDSIRKLAAAGNATTNDYLQKARMLSEEERQTHYVPTPAEAYALANPDAPVKPRKPQPPRKRLDEGRNYTGNVRWTTLEKAKIVRMVQWFQEHGVKTSLGRMMVEAQELVLSADRRRAVAGLMQANHGGQNTRTFADGLNNLWLLKDVPFNPPTPPGAEAQAEEQAEEAQETAQEATNGAEVLQTPPVASPAAPAALPLVAPGTLRESMTAAVAQFGDTLRGAMDTLLMQHTALVVHQMEMRMSAMASQTAAEVAGIIERELRKSVHAMVEQELGGPVTPPPAAPAGVVLRTDGERREVPSEPAAQVPAPATPTAVPKVRQLKVDVVGLNTPDLEQRVRRGFGPEVDLRFWSPDSAGSYTPHRGRECIMVIQRVPHTLRHKVKAAGVEPLYVKATEGHVIHAIEELQRAFTVANAAHHH